MQFIEGVLGDSENMIFPRSVALRERVPLERPASRVHVFLRGFEVGFHGTDRELNRIQVMVELASGRDPLEVDVIARVTLQDASPSGEFIQAAVYYTILAD